MTTIITSCPHCTAANEFSVQGFIAPAEEIACSTCRRPIGRWEEIEGSMARLAGLQPAGASGKQGHAA